MAVLLRIFAKLWYRLWRVIWYPLALAWRRVFGICVLLGFGYIVSLFFQSEDLSQPIPTAPVIASPEYPGGDPAQQAKNQTAPKDPSLIQPVLRYQDGNSAFSDDLLTKMKGDELRFYSNVFYQVMSNTADQTPQGWQFVNVHGTLTPTSSFKNKLGQTCRMFKETLKVHDTQQRIHGMACQQQGGGWCKLRTHSTPACDLGRKGGFNDWWFDTKQGILGVFR